MSQRVIINEDEIENAIRPAVMLARDHYSGKDKSSSKSSARPKYSPPPKDSGAHYGSETPNYGLETPRFSFDEIQQKAVDIAEETEKPVITKVFQRLRKILFGKDE